MILELVDNMKTTTANLESSGKLNNMWLQYGCVVFAIAHVKYTYCIPNTLITILYNNSIYTIRNLQKNNLFTEVQMHA